MSNNLAAGDPLTAKRWMAYNLLKATASLQLRVLSLAAVPKQVLAVRMLVL